jgi:hypothetical protein
MSFGQDPFNPQGGFPAPGGYSPNAAGMVTPPAIALIVMGVFDILGALYNIISGILGAAAPAQPVPADPNAAQVMRIIQAVSGPMAIAIGVLLLIMGILIIVGALKMKNLQSYGLAMTSSILAMFPCSLCCLVGLPIGIWSLVVLSKPEVKSAFH